MKKSPLRWLAIPILTGAAMLLTSGGSVRAQSSPMPQNAAAIRALVLPVEKKIGQRGLADFLTATAWTESNFNPNAENDIGYKGLFQMSDNSSMVDDLGVSGDVLFNPRWSIALISWYIERLRKYAEPGQVIDWLAVRRGMAYPHLVSDVQENKPAKPGAVPGQRSREVRERLESGLDYVGLPRSFMYKPAFASGYKWPGIQAVLSSVGIGGVS